MDKYRCDECDFTTHNNANLVRHLERIHMGLSYRSIKLCDGVFNRKSGLKIHREVKHSYTECKYPCEQCDFQGT